MKWLYDELMVTVLIVVVLIHDFVDGAVGDVEVWVVLREEVVGLVVATVRLLLFGTADVFHVV
jgi:hypothetical protein